MYLKRETKKEEKLLPRVPFSEMLLKKKIDSPDSVLPVTSTIIHISI